MASTTELQQKPSIRIFSSPSLKPDVRLEVFGTEFHVHSIILKLNSAFFRKFLDSLNKKPLESPPAPFRYEWVTKVDEDGQGWCLVDAGTQIIASNIEFAKDRSFETTTFERLICAMYGKPYHLEWRLYNSCLGLRNLTAMADYYCALPAVSRSLYSVLLTDSYIKSGVVYSMAYFPLALKLRNPVLCREVVIFAINPWRYPRFKAEKNKLALQEYKYLDHVYNKISAMTVEFNMITKLLSERHVRFRSHIQNIRKSISKDEYYLHPEYYFKISQSNCDLLLDHENNGDNDYDDYDEKDRFSFLLRNLTGIPTELPSSDQVSNCRDGFLYIDIEDKDLPWDTTQEDW